MATKSIFRSFPITNDEYKELERKFGDLCIFQSWQLKRRNVKNNPGVDLDDFIQDQRMALLTAGCYYKRQKYIESSLELAAKHVTDDFTSKVVAELQNLWDNRKRHGANRQKFGDHQERLLSRLIKQVVPQPLWPKKNRPLEFDNKFTNYCKSITWNKQKAAGRKITKDRSFRSNLVSLSEFDYLGSDSSNSFDYMPSKYSN
jgi:hypothetical protein